MSSCARPLGIAVALFSSAALGGAYCDGGLGTCSCSAVPTPECTCTPGAPPCAASCDGPCTLTCGNPTATSGVRCTFTVVSDAGIYCESGDICTVVPNGAADNVTVFCDPSANGGSNCTSAAALGKNAIINCSVGGGNLCAFTAGDNSVMYCQNGATCTLTCTGPSGLVACNATTQACGAAGCAAAGDGGSSTDGGSPIDAGSASDAGSGGGPDAGGTARDAGNDAGRSGTDGGADAGGSVDGGTTGAGLDAGALGPDRFTVGCGEGQAAPAAVLAAAAAAAWLTSAWRRRRHH